MNAHEQLGLLQLLNVNAYGLSVWLNYEEEAARNTREQAIFVKEQAVFMKDKTRPTKRVYLHSGVSVIYCSSEHLEKFFFYLLKIWF